MYSSLVCTLRTTTLTSGASFLIRRAASRPLRPGTTIVPDTYDELTDREREVLWLVAEGCSNREIAEAFDIIVRAVETHKARMMNKLGLHGRAALTRYAIGKAIVVIDQ